MKAFGYSEKGPVSADAAVVAFDAPRPTPEPDDVLVEVRAISVNPVDFKVRNNRPPPDGDPTILGWDASGVVLETGSAVSQYKAGDEVFYAGEFTRPGSNAQMQLVDQRLVGRKPSSIDFAHAAALPLTSITAWEILFDSFGLTEGDGAGEAILVVGGAGGVGSILVQLAKQLTSLTVIATASRPETEAWVKKMGADHVVNHKKPLDEELKALGISPRYVASLTATDTHFESIIELIKPRGHIAIIDDPPNLNIAAIKLKALSFSWEFMFARSMFKADDMDAQNKLLNRVSELVDQGKLVSTINKNAGTINVDNLRAALEEQQSGTAVGKIVLEGFA